MTELESMQQAFDEMTELTAQRLEALKEAESQRDELLSLLHEGATGFGRVLIATSDDKAVRNWQRRATAAIAEERKEQSHAMQNIRSANKALAATEADFGQYILCEKEPVAWENPDLYPQIVDHQRRSTDAPLYRARRPE